MKRINLFIIAGLVIGLLNSCFSDEDYTNENVDPINPTEVPASFLMTSATKSLFDRMTSTSVNQNIFRLVAQYWTETTYTTETNYDIRNRDLPGALWNELYMNVLFDLKEAKSFAENNTSILESERLNQVAIIDVLEVYTYQVLVDAFGDIPYTEALNALDGNTTPAYDDAETIYLDLLNRISQDIANLDVASEGFGTDDIIFQGDVSKWKKFAASLQLKLAMTLSDSHPDIAQAHAEQAFQAGLIASNADNVLLQYLSPPNQNPLYTSLVLSGRNDFLPSNTLIDYLNDLDDPRRMEWFASNLGAGVYLGGLYGALSVYEDHTNFSERFFQYDMPGVLMDYSEVEFLLAEAAARGYSVTGTAQEHYNNGITANMEYWGVDNADITTYLNRNDVDYNSAPGDWRQKIGKQFWLAMYNRGFEGWNVWRKFNAPELNLPDLSQNPVPLRFTYPADEQTLNVTNYNAASQAIGGDDQQTRIFWDVN